MIGGIRSVSVERGHDPRDFGIVAGGGATSAHVGRLAADLRIRDVIIPKVASGLCAFGEAVADVKHTYLASYTVPLPALDAAPPRQALPGTRGPGEATTSPSEGFADDEMYVERSVDMKYVDQVHECRVDVPARDDRRKLRPEIENAFHRRHEALYTYCERDNVAELINIEVSVYGRSPEIASPRRGSAAPPYAAPLGERLAYFEESGEYRPTPVYDASTLAIRRGRRGPGDRRGGVHHDRRVPRLDPAGAPARCLRHERVIRRAGRSTCDLLADHGPLGRERVDELEVAGARKREQLDVVAGRDRARCGHHLVRPPMHVLGPAREHVAECRVAGACAAIPRASAPAAPLRRRRACARSRRCRPRAIDLGEVDNTRQRDRRRAAAVSFCGTPGGRGGRRRNDPSRRFA